MTRNLSLTLGRILFAFFIVGTVAVLATYSLYFYKFGRGADWLTLSRDQELWGAFGDFVGGILNPIFSFLAFLGVALTIGLQSRQLSMVRSQSGIEELQRLAAGLSARVDEFLREPMRNPLHKGQSFHDVLMQAGLTAIEKTENWNAYAFSNRDLEAHDAEVKVRAFLMEKELESLAWTMSKYRSSGGSALIGEFYANRYVVHATWLHVLGLLGPGQVSAHIREVFRPEETVKGIRDAQAPSKGSRSDH
ncbi:MAG: hypothetical protein KF892_23470 [Rhizobacter sp.]|nr:hypothetical protein [Rhizobacter sp.]